MSRSRRHPERPRPGAIRSAQPPPGCPVFDNCSFPGDVNFHIHAGYNGGRGAATDSVARRVFAMAREVGPVILPDRDGKPRAFVLAATPAVCEWVEQEFDSESPAWLIDKSASAAQTPCANHSTADNDGQRTVITTESDTASQEWSIPGPHTT
jgi:hypothetical protein